MKRFSPWSAILTATTWVSIQAQHAGAQNPAILVNSANCNYTTGRLSASCIPLLIGHVIQTIFGLVSILFLINVMIAGYQIAFGSMEGSQSGKDRVRWSIIGLIASVCIYLIIDLFITIISP